MKSLKKSLLLTSVLIALLVSCGTTSSTQDKKTVSAPSPKDTEFIESLNSVKINVLQTPRPAEFDKPFTSSFIFQAKNTDGSILPNYNVTIEYPVSHDDDDIKYEKTTTFTDESGKVLFKPTKTDFTVNAKIYCYPTPPSSKKSTVMAAKEARSSTKFQIKSRIASKGALLFIWEYNERNKPTTNCYTILSELQARGTTVGNAPVNQESYIGASTDTIYKKNYEIVQNNFGFLIGGTIKYEKPVAKNDDNLWECSLVSEIYVIDMTSGKEIFRKTYDCDEEDSKYDKAVSNCKKAISKEIVDDLVDNI